METRAKRTQLKLQYEKIKKIEEQRQSLVDDIYELEESINELREQYNNKKRRLCNLEKGDIHKKLIPSVFQYIDTYTKSSNGSIACIRNQRKIQGQCVCCLNKVISKSYEVKHGEAYIIHLCFKRSSCLFFICDNCVPASDIPIRCSCSNLYMLKSLKCPIFGCQENLYISYCGNEMTIIRYCDTKHDISDYVNNIFEKILE